MDDSQIKIRDQHAEEGEYWSSGGGMSIQTESTKKSTTNSSDADEADTVARAPKRDKPTSDGSDAARNTDQKRVKQTSDGSDAARDIASDLPADQCDLKRFIKSGKFFEFRKLVLNEPNNYKHIRDNDNDVKNLLPKDPSVDPLLKEIIASIIEGCHRLSFDDRKTIVEKHPEYRKFIRRMEGDPNNKEDHVEEVEKDPFLKELFSQDPYCAGMLDEMDHKIDMIKYYIKKEMKSYPSIFESESGARTMIESIQRKVECTEFDALFYLLHSATGSTDEAVDQLKKRKSEKSNQS